MLTYIIKANILRPQIRPQIWLWWCDITDCKDDTAFGTSEAIKLDRYILQKRLKNNV